MGSKPSLPTQRLYWCFRRGHADRHPCWHEPGARTLCQVCIVDTQQTQRTTVHALREHSQSSLFTGNEQSRRQEQSSSGGAYAPAVLHTHSRQVIAQDSTTHGRPSIDHQHAPAALLLKRLHATALVCTPCRRSITVQSGWCARHISIAKHSWVDRALLKYA